MVVNIQFQSSIEKGVVHNNVDRMRRGVKISVYPSERPSLERKSAYEKLGRRRERKKGVQYDVVSPQHHACRNAEHAP